jgi:hypothetical protein
MRGFTTFVLQAAIVLAGLAATGAAKAEPIMLDCRLDFSITSWSADKQFGYGVGNIKCTRGNTLVVKVRVMGDGVANREVRIGSAHGKFKPVRKMEDLVRTYKAGGSNASAEKGTQVLGNLTLSGEEGWDHGIRFQQVELDRARTKSS